MTDESKKKERSKEELRDLLRKLFAMLGSPHDSEVLVAKARIDAICEKYSLSWNAALELMGARFDGGDDDDAKFAKIFEQLMKDRRKTADILIELARAAAYFHTPDGTAWADVNINEHRETWPVRSRRFKLWLRHRYFETQKSAPNAEAVETAVAHLEAAAHFGGVPKREVYTRVAAAGDKVFLDLADDDWTVIEIDASGWRAIKEAPTRFRRTESMAALPMPQRDGSLEPLRRLVNVEREDFVLVVAWLLAALRGRRPFPILAFAGPPGAAKSTLVRFLSNLIDPSALEPGALQREQREIAIGATKRYVMGYDNLSGIPDDIADALCRLATGGGFSIRSLYTDDTEKIFSEVRPVLLAGIEDIAGRHDLADRTIALVLHEIPEARRKEEGALNPAFEAARPAVLGRLLDIVVHGLGRISTIRLEHLPRMADFARWMAACETSEWPAGTFAKAYAANRAALATVSAEEDIVATAVVDFVKIKKRVAWIGTAKELLALLSEQVGETLRKAKDWPRTPRALSGKLRRATGVLRANGVAVTPPTEADKTRTWRLDLAPEGDPARYGRDSTAQTARPPETEESANVSSDLDSGGWSRGSDGQQPEQPIQPPAGNGSGGQQQPNRPTAQATARDNSLKNNGLGGLGGLSGDSPSLSGKVCAYCGDPADHQPLRVAGDGTRTALLHRRCEVAWLHSPGRYSTSTDPRAMEEFAPEPARNGRPYQISTDPAAMQQWGGTGWILARAGRAITDTPEDRHEVPPEHVACRIWIKEIVPPGLGPPGDDLNDFVAF